MTRDEIILDLSERSAGAGEGQYMSLRCDVAREIADLLKEQQPKAAGMTEAEKREKVIWGLEACNRKSYNGSDCQNCPYYEDEYEADMPFGMCNIQDMFDDALTLLKEQEPRVMTYEEIKDNLGVPVWVEYTDNENWNGYGVPTSVHKAYIMIYGANAYCAHNARSHNVKWRCWTSRPTPEKDEDGGEHDD